MTTQPVSNPDPHADDARRANRQRLAAIQAQIRTHAHRQPRSPGSYRSSPEPSTALVCKPHPPSIP